MSTNFQSSYMEEYTVKKTYLESPGFCFEVNDANVVGDLEAFTELYTAQRKQRWIDHDWNGSIWSEANDIGYQNFLKVLEEGNYKMGYYENTFFNRVPARIKCCDQWLSLGSFTNTCEHCNADYNSGGQLLADRRFWGEETGEHWSECC
jgi:hypothetical protein